MRRFNYDGSDEYRDDVDQFFDEDEYEYDDEYDDEYIRDASLIEIVHTNLATLDLNQKLLIAAIKVAEKSFLWGLWPLKWKLQAISDAYHTLDNLVDADSDENEEDQEE